MVINYTQLIPALVGILTSSVNDVLNSSFIDRRPALLSVLRSLLVAFSSLTSSLLAPPPTNSSTTPPEWQRHVEWITVMSQNIMAAANDLRPVQACPIIPCPCLGVI